MKTKKEIIEIVKNTPISADDEPFYRFACTYLFGMKRRDVIKTEEFFKLISFAESKPYVVRKQFGIAGKNKDEALKNWCGIITRHKKINLDIDDLRQLFGYCAYEAKIKRELN